MIYYSDSNLMIWVSEVLVNAAPLGWRRYCGPGGPFATANKTLGARISLVRIVF